MNLKITDVRVQPGDSAFLLDDGVTSILYDSGFAFTGYALADKIRSILGDRQLDYIFLTHSHYDHALGSVYIKARYPSVKLVAGEYAAEVFDRPTARAVMRELDRKHAAHLGVFQYEDRIDELQVDITVRDGDMINAGDMVFSVVALPGHTKCSVGFYLESERLLLSTETLGVYDGRDIVVPSFLVGYQMTRDSIAKVRSMGVGQFLLPHYGLLEADKTAFYLAECDKNAELTAEQITEILKKGGSYEDAVTWFRDTYYSGRIQPLYPEAAMLMNTNIMVRLIEQELL